MTDTSAVPNHGRLAQLAAAIVRRRHDIEKRWLERIASAVNRPDVSPSELRDGMPEYLLRLVAGLQHESTAAAGGSASWESVAREHADARVRVGFDIDQLVQDFIVLRTVLTEVLDEEHVLYDVRQYVRLADLIEGAIKSAVTSYVESRDYELRKQQAQHLAFLTHELRSPLATAMLGLEQLHRSLELSPVQAGILETVARNHQRLEELIDSVLILEKDAHDVRPRVEPVTVRALLQEPLVSASFAAQAKGLQLGIHLGPDVVVRVDPRLAASAIDNVVQNAIKYTDDGNVELDVEECDDDVVVHVRDNCAGIAPDELQTMFEPFRRGGHSRKPGAGLGLAIARKALEVQGGTIGAESGPGRGCHFWVTLPKERHH